MNPRLRVLHVMAVGLLFAYGCQGDGAAPEPAAGILAGAAQCPWPSGVENVYAQNKIQAEKNKACRTTAQLVSRGQQDAAEAEINALLVALSTDYALCVGGVFGPQDLSACPLAGGANVDPSAVVAFAQAVCDLGVGFLPQAGDVDCVVPSVANLAQPSTPAPGQAGFDPVADVAGGWIAVGPVPEGATIVLPNGEIAHTLDDLDVGVSEVFVTIRENPPIAILGNCPGLSNEDCVQNNYTTDMDNPNDPIGPGGGDGGLYTEVCEGNVDFADIPGRCAGGTCAQAANAVDPPRGILGCSKGAVDFRPSVWTVVDADPAARAVICSVTSQSAAISEGTLCRVKLRAGGFVAGKQCVTARTGQFTSQCTIDGVAAADPAAAPGSPVLYTMVAEKQTGTGSHSGSTDFALSQTSPAMGNTLTVEVMVLPQGQQ